MRRTALFAKRSFCENKGAYSLRLSDFSTTFAAYKIYWAALLPDLLTVSGIYFARAAFFYRYVFQTHRTPVADVNARPNFHPVDFVQQDRRCVYFYI